jgi:hypothetical protein
MNISVSGWERNTWIVGEREGRTEGRTERWISG